jgi:hypothetical protein
MTLLVVSLPALYFQHIDFIDGREWKVAKSSSDTILERFIIILLLVEKYSERVEGRITCYRKLYP